MNTPTQCIQAFIPEGIYTTFALYVPFPQILYMLTDQNASLILLFFNKMNA